VTLSTGATSRYDHGSMATIRVALAEDNVLLREGVSRLIAANEASSWLGRPPTSPRC